MKPPFHRRSPAKGFALVATLSVTALITILTIGLLSLSQATARRAVAEKARAEAQANARLSLMLALGALQKEMGPDQRISANGDILSDPNNPNSALAGRHWTGVWNSWKAGVGETSQHRTITGVSTNGMSPTYQLGRQDYFRSWLLSLDPQEAREWDAPTKVTLDGQALPGSGDSAVRLVGEGTLGSPANATDLVSARLLSVKSPAFGGPRSRFAWWVGDESQKASLLTDFYDQPGTTPTQAQKIARSQAPAAAGTKKAKGLEQITPQDDAKLPMVATRASLDLLDSAAKDSLARPSRNFHTVTPHSRMVLADVREGGLKRDLSVLLERPISLNETGDEFMLYRFGTGQDRVPFQDLAAFYQLYDQTRYTRTSESWRTGVMYDSNRLRNAVQLLQPEMGDQSSQDRYLREYQRMYKSSVPIKVQILVTMTAHPIPNAPAGGDTHFIRLHMMPAITLWNPTNLPLVMNPSNNDAFIQQMRFMSAGFNINWIKNGQELGRPLNLSYAAMGGDNNTGRPGWSNAGGKKATIFDMYFANRTYPITLAPGEVRVFSYDRAQASAGPFVFRKAQNDAYQTHQNAAPGWNPDVLFPMVNSIWGDGPHVYKPTTGGFCLSVKATDSLRIRFSTDQDDGTDYAHDSEWPGAAFAYMMIQNNHQSRATNLWGFRNYPALSRAYSQNTSQGSYGVRTNTRFNDSLLKKGFPGSHTTSPRGVGSLIALSNGGEHWPLFQFALMAGTETSESDGAYAFSGRKHPSRPFLHSSAITPPHIDSDDANSLYNYGMNWWVQDVNSILEANVQVEDRTNRGFYGGGHSPQYGTTQVVQQEVPVIPPTSIAGLGHALLGGYSLANVPPNLTNPETSAVGTGGLYPFTTRAIGNSYADPLLPPGRAFATVSRQFDGSAAARTVTFADHSYLANKALWDEYFFSSITPRNASVRVFERGLSQTARQVAGEIFAGTARALNPRIIPYSANLPAGGLDTLFARQNDYTDGLADRIAAHLMVEGAFNVNSTSVDAWRVLLTSLRGKPVAYLDKNRAMTGGAWASSTPGGTPVSALAVPLNPPRADSVAQPNEPDQWMGWRELTDTEIDELAAAIVRQVKSRGPFLSMSEFVNRRLDASNRPLSVKGALQAAIDDPSVSINRGFRNSLRQLDPAEIREMTPAFPEALEGPVAYGSTAYVNQADILRGLSEQLAPRGDTFIIRSYADSVDGSGRVVARAWCEAVVQRIPDYLDPTDSPHEKHPDITGTNKFFGRKLQVISFRWLQPSEV
jgi:type II secretory pathway pseudopilin PulG